MCLLIATVGPAAAQAPQEQRVVFATGRSSAEIKGSIRGNQSIAYVLGASAGQRLIVDMTPSNPSTYFNVMAPGASEAMHIGSINGNHFKTVIPSSGDYSVLVYLMRNAARREEHSAYSLTVSITSDQADSQAGAGLGSTGEIPCSLALGQPTRQCPFRANRIGNGNAEVWIRIANGKERHIEFRGGKPTRTDLGMSLKVERWGDLNLIRIGDAERYEVPDAVVNGG
ncbi:MAG: hypothetical protein KIS73_15715 [Enhydrobacter sp.]|nr:hypothetical protein [Enhydrobacter sp.]